MLQTLHATFAASSNADQAAGALLDYGVAPEELTLVAPEGYLHRYSADHHAKAGITTTTGADAAAGANKGAEVGLGLGILAGIVSMVVPGFGLVVGGGALATAIAGAIGGAIAGGIAGGLVGIMKDQGVPEHVITSYQKTLDEGGAVLTIALPTEEVDEATIRRVLDKYNAASVEVYTDTRVAL